MSEADDGFLARWSRRKHRSRAQSAPDPGSAIPPAVTPAVTPAADAGAPAASDTSVSAAGASGTRDSGASAGPIADGGAPADELPSIDSLSPASDFRPFMRTGVEPATRNAALKRLFADPQFNVMDGLDVYIDDYGKTEPIPPALLGRLLGPHAAQESGSQLPESRSPQSQSPAWPPDSGGDVPVFASSGPGSRGGDDKARIEATQGGSQGNALDRCGKGAAGDGAGDGDAAPVASHPDVRGIDADPCPDVHRR